MESGSGSVGVLIDIDENTVTPDGTLEHGGGVEGSVVQDGLGGLRGENVGMDGADGAGLDAADGSGLAVGTLVDVGGIGAETAGATSNEDIVSEDGSGNADGEPLSSDVSVLQAHLRCGSGVLLSAEKTCQLNEVHLSHHSRNHMISADSHH